MTIGTDFEVQNDKDIRYIGAAHGVSGAGYYTVLELHRWIQDLADDAASAGDDYMDMTRDTPSDKSFDTIINLINGYNIDADASEHLYGGSIIQEGGDEIYDGIQIVANAGAHVEVVQDAAIIANDFWNSTPFGSSDKGLNPDTANGISHRFMVLVRTAGADIDGRRLLFQTREFGYTYSEFKINGTGRGVNVAPLTYASDLNNQTASGTVATWTTITNTTSGYNGIDVNNDLADEYYYSEWNIATYTINQFYERMKYLTRRGTAETLYGMNGELFRGITHEVNVDTPSGTFSAYEPISWGVDLASVQITGTEGQFSCTATTIVVGQILRISGTWGGTGSITGYSDPTSYRVSVTNGTTTFTLVALSGAALTTTAGTPTGLRWDLRSGTGTMLAINSTTAATKLWMQLLTGVAPTNNQLITGLTSGANCLMDTTLVERTLSFPFCGVSTGSAIIGAYGFGIEATDLSASDKVFDLTNTQRTAPNYQDFTVGGIISGEDSVQVAPNDGGAIDFDFFTLNGALTGAAVTSVVVNEAIPTWLPSTGTIRILRANGKYTRHEYSAYSTATKTFTITSHDFSTNNAANGANCYPTPIDKVAASTSESFTGIYTSDISLFVRVRDGGATPIKTFETTATFGAGGGSATAVRTSDA